MFAHAMSSTNPTAATRHEQGGPDVGDHLLLKRNQTHARGGQIARADAWRRRRLHALRDRGSLGFRFRQRDAALEPRDRTERHDQTLTRTLGFIGQRHRRPDRSVSRSGK